MAITPLREKGFYSAGFAGGQHPTVEDGALSFDSMLDLLRAEHSYETITLDAGAIAPETRFVLVDTQAAASSDQLDIIQTSEVIDGWMCWVSQATAGHVVTVRNLEGDEGEPGRIALKDGSDVDLNSLTKVLVLQLRGAIWFEVGRFGFSGAGGGSGGVGEVEIVAEKTANFTLSEDEFGSDVERITPLNSSSGNIQITIPKGLSQNAGRQRVAHFLKDSSANAITIVGATTGGGATPDTPVTQTFEFSVNSTTGGINSANFGPQQTFNIPAGTNLVWGVFVSLNFQTDATRSMSLKIGGNTVAWNSSQVDTASVWGNLGSYLFYEALGDTTATQSKLLQMVAGVTGGARSYAMFAFYVANAKQSAFIEGLNHDHNTVGASSKLVTVTTTDVNRRVLYFTSRKNLLNATTDVATVSGATLLDAEPIGTALNSSNQTAAVAHEAVASATTADCTFTFPNTNIILWCGLAILPVGAGGITIKTRAGAVASITADQSLISIFYDGLNDFARVQWT